jgi:hypothetical protein
MCQSGTIRGPAASYNSLGTYVVAAAVNLPADQAILSYWP